jgi:hypothetical protein
MKKIVFGEDFKSTNLMFARDEMMQYRNTIWCLPILDEDDINFYTELYKKAGYEITMATENEDFYFVAENDNLNEDDDDTEKIDKLSETVAKEIAEKKFHKFWEENCNIFDVEDRYFENLIAENNQIEIKIDSNITNIRLTDLEYLKLLKDDLLQEAMDKLGYVNSCRMWKKQ